MTDVSLAESLNLAQHFLAARLDEGCGDKIAVHTPSRDWTYAEVADRAWRFGHVLRDAGVRAEERVLIALPDGIDMVAAIFGTLAIGAVVVMVNPELDDDGFGYFLEYSRARALVTHQPAMATLDNPAAASRHLLRTLVVDDGEFEARLTAAQATPDFFPTHRDDAAIWLFSGGTTGKPKAVVQSHRSFVNTTELYAKRVLGLTAADITASVPKLYFGYATGSNLLFPFAVGASCVLIPDRCTPDVLFDAIERFRPTVLINVPTMIGKLLASDRAASADLSSLRLSTSAGEALPEELYRSFRDRFKVEVLDGLGTAEMWHVFLTNHPGDVRSGTLGKPVAGFDVRVRDDEGRDVPDGEVGWLWVRGGSRAQQYWQQAERAEQAFRGEWYVSGDMIRRDADGYFHYCGRGDDMLKVSGKWLAPKEVEDCLSTHACVAEVAVVGRADDAGLIKPCAFVRLRDNASERDPVAVERLLREHAQTHLERYKAPRQVIVLDDFPRTHLGKIDRGRLRGWT